MRASPHLLVVGANVFQRNALARMLEQGGAFRVTEVDGGRRALMETRRERFGAVIIDTPLAS